MQPRASELTKIPTKPKVPLTEKEKEILQKAKIEARQKELVRTTFMFSNNVIRNRDWLVVGM